MLARMKAWENEAVAVVVDTTRTETDLNFDAVSAACKDASLIRSSILSLRKTVGIFLSIDTFVRLSRGRRTVYGLALLAPGLRCGERIVLGLLVLLLVVAQPICATCNQ